jgi:methyltransferase (TIGR00027 family)
MDQPVASKTALITSLARAIHTRTAAKPILNDPWGDVLVPDSAREAVRKAWLLADSVDLESFLKTRPAHSVLITRPRYTEDALHAALGSGIRQYVLIDAGFDSYALRTPAEAQRLSIFEVDHPATQSLKQARIRECGVQVREGIHFLPADLRTESLDQVLTRSAFRSSDKSFFSWLGVTFYLTRDANLATLRAIARCAKPGSDVVFDYIKQSFFDEKARGIKSDTADSSEAVASIGEPVLSGFDPTTLSNVLESVGFELVENPSEQDLIDRYDPEGANGFKPSGQFGVARARVGTVRHDADHKMKSQS